MKALIRAAIALLLAIVHNLLAHSHTHSLKLLALDVVLQMTMIIFIILAILAAGFQVLTLIARGFAR